MIFKELHGNWEENQVERGLSTLYPDGNTKSLFSNSAKFFSFLLVRIFLVWPFANQRSKNFTFLFYFYLFFKVSFLHYYYLGDALLNIIYKLIKVCQWESTIIFRIIKLLNGKFKFSNDEKRVEFIEIPCSFSQLFNTDSFKHFFVKGIALLAFELNLVLNL